MGKVKGLITMQGGTGYKHGQDEGGPEKLMGNRPTAVTITAGVLGTHASFTPTDGLLTQPGGPVGHGSGGAVTTMQQVQGRESRQDPKSATEFKSTSLAHQKL